MNMIKALVLDDGYHNKDVVMFYENKSLLRVSLAYFINIHLHLRVPHSEDYQIKIAHYEDIEDNCFIDMFDKLSCMRSLACIDDEDLICCFQKLYDSDEAADGCDIR